MKLGLKPVLNLWMRMESGKSLVKIQNWNRIVVTQTNTFLLQVRKPVPNWSIDFSRTPKGSGDLRSLCPDLRFCFSPAIPGAETKSLGSTVQFWVPGEHSGKSSKITQKGHRMIENNTSQSFSSSPNRHQTFSNSASAATGVPFLVNRWGRLGDL